MNISRPYPYSVDGGALNELYNPSDMQTDYVRAMIDNFEKGDINGKAVHTT